MPQLSHIFEGRDTLRARTFCTYGGRRIWLDSAGHGPHPRGVERVREFRRGADGVGAETETVTGFGVTSRL